VNGATGVGGDDFAAARGSAAEIGAKQGAPGGGRASAAHGETNAVADEAQETFAGRRFHDGCRLRHFNSGLTAGWRYDSAVTDGKQRYFRGKSA
jgi:hypothetical protein